MQDPGDAPYDILSSLGPVEKLGVTDRTMSDAVSRRAFHSGLMPSAKFIQHSLWLWVLPRE